ncbi:MAG: filamentous hemagglutinin N-terminal domain-containing protein [Pseudomonadota bacterium]
MTVWARNPVLALAILAAWAGLAPGQVVTDGTLGPAATLSPVGINVAIPQTLGQQRGANLFHSFETFSVGSGLIASFEADPTVGRVISRVTGGAVSQIDGAVAVFSPSADLVFINPAGITLGPGGQFFSFGGAVHLAAADRVTFADGAVFSAGDPAGSTLTVAPPSAFGFLPSDAGALRVAGASAIGGTPSAVTLAGPAVEVAGTSPFSGLGSAILVENLDGRIVLSGGGPGSPVPLDGSAGGPPAGAVRIGDAAQISVNGFGPGLAGSIVIRGADIGIDGGSIVSANSFGGGDRGQITVEGGVIDIAGGAGLTTLALEAPLDAPDITLAGERVRVAESATVDASGLPFFPFPFEPFGAGIIAVDAGELVLESGGQLISVDTTGPGGRGGEVQIDATSVMIDGFGINPSGVQVFGADLLGLGAGTGGTVRIVADTLAVSDGAELSANSGAGGVAGSVVIDAGAASFTGTPFLQPQINLQGFFGGTAGRFELTAETVRFDNADVNADFVGGFTDEAGSAGLIRIDATTIELAGDTDLAVAVLGNGAPGDIALTASETLTIGDDAAVFSSAFGGAVGGDIALTAGQGITLDGNAGVASFGDLGGQGGSIVLTAPNVWLSDNALVGTTTFDTGQGGDVRVFAFDVTLEDRASINTATLGAGDAGSVFVMAEGTLGLSGSASIFASADENPDTGPPPGGSIGAGGDVEIVAGQLSLAGDAGGAPQIRVSATSPVAGDAGELTVDAGGIDLSGGAQIRADAAASGGGRLILTADGLTRLQGSSLETNVATGEGTGGDISVTSAFIVGDGDSAFIATALDGDGGNIFLSAGGVFLEPGAVIDASSLGGGIDGTVEIDGAQENPTDLAAIAAGFLDPRQLLRDPCLSAASGRSSLTVVAGQGGGIDGQGVPGLFGGFVPLPDADESGNDDLAALARPAATGCAAASRGFLGEPPP